MPRHLHANNFDFARCYYDDPTTVHLVISDPDDYYFGQSPCTWHKVFDVPRATHNEPGRHRLEGREHSADAVFRIATEWGQRTNFDKHVGKFECPRRWVDGIAVEFEYL